MRQRRLIATQRRGLSGTTHVTRGPRIASRSQPKLLIIDEVGYIGFDALQASLLFQVICNRYQRHQSIALTSNKAFGDWGQVFNDDAVMAGAALDRLLHRSTVINVRGDSYRLREKKQAGSTLVHAAE